MSADGRAGLLRRKAPELLLEAVLIIFAVLVALAVDEWNDGRELRTQVERAGAAVEAEIRANRDELHSSGPTVQALHDSVAAGVARLRGGGRIESTHLGAELPEFSNAAWETARVTGVVAHMDYPRVLEVARLYQTQELAAEARDRLLATLGGLVARGMEEELLTQLQGELFIALQLYANLAERYEEALSAH